MADFKIIFNPNILRFELLPFLMVIVLLATTCILTLIFIKKELKKERKK